MKHLIRNDDFVGVNSIGMPSNLSNRPAGAVQDLAKQHATSGRRTIDHTTAFQYAVLYRVSPQDSSLPDDFYSRILQVKQWVLRYQMISIIPVERYVSVWDFYCLISRTRLAVGSAPGAGSQSMSVRWIVRSG